MNPYLSWAILLVVAGGLGWYYANPTSPKLRASTSRPVVEKSDSGLAAKKPKRKAKKSPEILTPERSSTPVSKAQGASTTVAQKAAVVDSAVEDDSIDNKDFARRFAKVKNGTSLAAPVAKNSNKNARQGQKKAGSGSSDRSASHASTRTSSTTGGDADDDLSPVTSPLVNATVPAPASGDVTDMLEGPAPGASVLRLTGSMQSEPKKKTRQESFKPVETKKQRQQRLKNEARKLEVAEAERQRRGLLEKQLHTAREFERNQASKQQAPQTNAWKSTPPPKAANGPSQPAAKGSSALLDTFDRDSSAAATGSTQTKPVAQPWSAPAEKVSSSVWAKDVPSEEEQMRLLDAMNSEHDWTTVSSKKKEKKKGGKIDDSVSEASASETPVSSEWVAPPASSFTIPEPARSFAEGGGHPLDSDWVA